MTVVVERIRNAGVRAVGVADITKGENMRRVLTFASAGLLVLAACGGSDKSTGPGLSNGTVTATVDGANWSGTVAISATYSHGTLTVGAAHVQISSGLVC